jgi:hypothetical protein
MRKSLIDYSHAKRVQSHNNGCELQLFKSHQLNTWQAFHIVDEAVQRHYLCLDLLSLREEKSCSQR